MKQLYVAHAQFVASFFHHHHDAVSLIGTDSVFQYVNPAFERLYGLPASDVVGQSVWKLWPENVDDFPWMAHQMEIGGEVSAYETKRARLDGSTVCVSLTISPIRGEDGAATAYLTVGRDITRAKQMEQSLRETESMFRIIDEHISDAVSLLEKTGIVRYASSSHRSFLGRSGEELVGLLATLWVHPDDHERAKAAFRTVVQAGVRQKADFRLQHADGMWVETETVLSPILDSNGRVSQVIAVSRDITDRRRTEQLLVQAEKMSVVGQLGAALAHEVRNPLTAMKGFLQLMKKDLNYNEEYIQIVLSELGQVEAIIEEFLAMSKPRLTEIKRCEVTRIVDQSITMMRPTAHMHNIDIDFIATEGPLRIDADEVKLKQVFVNLLKNAIESMAHGGRITVTLTRTDDEVVRIQIADQGCGISPEALENLGNPFFSTKDAGTGLGLTVSLGILRDHCAHVDFASEVGKGTTVSIEIPIEQARAADGDLFKA